MADPTIILTFNDDGTVEREVKNMEGKSCSDFAAFLDQALGTKDAKVKYKPEYYKQEKKLTNRHNA